MPGIDPEGKRLPIKLDSTSNGEFAPVPLWPANLEANRLAHEAAARMRSGWDAPSGAFLTSACGAASTLLAFNAANAAAGRTGGFFDLPKEAALDLQLARAQVGPARQEFILDVQGHFIDTPKGNPKSAEVFLKDVFMDSDTDVMVLSFVPSARNAEPVTIQAADEVRRLVDKLEGTHRLLLHGRVNPNQPGDLEGMDELQREVGRQRLEDLHAVRSERRGLLPARRRRHSLHREGARPGRQEHLHPQGAALRPPLLRAQPVQRHRRRRQALSGRELPHLSLGLRQHGDREGL